MTIRQTINSKDIKVYFNLGYIILIIDLIFISTNIKIKIIPTNIVIRGLKSKIYYFNMFIIITFFLYNLVNKKPTIILYYQRNFTLKAIILK